MVANWKYYTGQGATPPTIPVPTVAPSAPVQITAPFVLARGQTLYFTGQALLQEGDAPITNAGLVQAIVNGAATGIAEATENPDLHVFINKASGVLSAEAQTGDATGYDYNCSPVETENKGVIQAVALAGNAYGIWEYGCYGAGTLYNRANGLVAVWASGAGYGIWGYQLGVALDNQGLIYVTAGKAVGVTGVTSFANTGSIIAVDIAQDGGSIGVVLGSLYGQAQTIANAGFVQADKAISSDAGTEMITLTNSGVIKGAVELLNAGTDVITNTGKIAGAVTCPASPNSVLTNSGVIKLSGVSRLTIVRNQGLMKGQGVITASIAGGGFINLAGARIESRGDLTLAAPTGSIKNNGVLEADGGVLEIAAPVEGSGSGVIAAGTLKCDAAFSQNVAFTGSGGVLELAQSQAYAGTVSGLSATGSSSLDLLDIRYVGSGEASFADNGQGTGGVLTVTDGEGDTAHISLSGAYGGLAWVTASDGHGGVTVAASSGSGAATRLAQAAAGLGARAGALEALPAAWRETPAPMLVAPRAALA